MEIISALCRMVVRRDDACGVGQHFAQFREWPVGGDYRAPADWHNSASARAMQHRLRARRDRRAAAGAGEQRD